MRLPTAVGHTPTDETSCGVAGTGILQDLHKQRETIGHARETLHGADDDIGRSRRILTSMARRAVQNKVMLVGSACAGGCCFIVSRCFAQSWAFLSS